MVRGLNRTSREQSRLLWRIRQRFDVVTDAHFIAGHRFNFTRVIDPDVVLDQVVAEEDRREKLSGKRRLNDELHLPYWAELWDSAFGIAQFLMKRSAAAVGGKSALDLGCGMGFAGMAAAAAGYRVMLADMEAEALLFAQLNVPCARTRRLDWRRDRLGERFDLIIGADVLYDKTQWEFLEPFWRAHLASGGTVLLGEPGRQTGDLFVEWIAGRGWSLSHFEEKVATRERGIRLFRLVNAGL
jgi:predicted nicotinamide N-methyase